MGLSHLDNSEELLVTIFSGLQHLAWIVCNTFESLHHNTQKPPSTVVYVTVTKWPYIHDPQYICCYTCSLSWTLFGFVGWQSEARWPDSHSGWRQIGWVYTRAVSWISLLPCFAIIIIINCVYSKCAIICPTPFHFVRYFESKVRRGNLLENIWPYAPGFNAMLHMTSIVHSQWLLWLSRRTAAWLVVYYGKSATGTWGMNRGGWHLFKGGKLSRFYDICKLHCANLICIVV